MTQLYEMEQEQENVILVSVNVKEHVEAEESLDELEELVSTAGANTVGRVIQNLEHVNQATYVGKGKLEEIRMMIDALGATGIVCDDELSPAQIKNLEDALDTKIMDRTLIILDIFAARARTREGKIQVELAQLKYRSSRLIGLRSSLSRLGGGIGTRGPGEKKLEIDRRLIRDRISQLSRELAEVKKNREVQRQLRSKQQTPVICIAGYTNAGKSTLLNRLTKAGVLEEDKLFATLDPTTRNLKLPKGQEILLTDTVGFIRKLPHHLVEAFRSTLEEAKYSDLILHVVDCSNPQMDKQMAAVYDTFHQLKIEDKTVITVFNKVDRIDKEMLLKDPKADHVIRISAKEEIGLTELLELIEEVLMQRQVYIEKVYAYADASMIQLIRKYGQLLEEEYRGDGIFVRGYVPKEMENQV
ncbi:MAG: GTPase HflX [Firmicutes bacterium]|uniref:GTPase HflX n=1 Tax=Candidatus Scybalomonas excrementavium TaxID=2840943 RepID=A0A9D9HXL0_9FIRM|nr:GTPase HflX [Candidatus Scybalomonas excrementavium]